MVTMWAQSPRVQRYATGALIIGATVQYFAVVLLDGNPFLHPFLRPDELALRLILYAIGSASSVGACYAWAKRGDYHGAWAWFGLLSILGIIILGAKFRHGVATREVRGFAVLPPARPTAPDPSRCAGPGEDGGAHAASAGGRPCA